MDESVLRASTPFAGGIGGGKEDICGALVGGLLAIGLIHGRTDPDVNDDACMEMAKDLRSKFLDHFGDTICGRLRENWVGQPGQPDCAELAAQAAGLLSEILN